MTAATPRTRFAVVGIVTLSLFCALFARLWFLQVMNAPSLTEAAEEQAVRVVRTEAPRGWIYDRDGDPLVKNRRTIAVMVDLRGLNRLDDVALCQDDRLGPDQSVLLANLAEVLSRDKAAQARGDVVANDPGPSGPVDGQEPQGAQGGGDDAVPGEPAEGDPASGAGRSTGLPAGSDGRRTGPTAPGDPLDPPTDAGETDRLTGSQRPGEPAEAFTASSLVDRLCDERFSRFKPVPVATDISEQLEVHLTEHEEQFPAVEVERTTVREYPYGSLAAHVLGYVGSITEEEIARRQNDEKPYELDDQVGKSGIEAMMESELRGVPGRIRYEVDARNQPVRKLSERPPQPGNDVYLSIDIDLQYVVEQALAAELDACGVDACPQQRTGSAVMVDPRNGKVLAMASYPTYDPRRFIGGISTEEFAALCPSCVNPDLEGDAEAANGNPLTNKAIAGQYAPGSTWKLFTAWAGLNYGQITPATVVNDEGSYQVQDCEGPSCEFNAPAAAGRVTLRGALTRSSDVYFYKLGDDLWRRREQIGEDALARAYRRWQFGRETGVGLPAEVDGRVPSPAEKEELARALCETDECAARRRTWYVGDNVNASIGQGLVEVTPLQLANGYATFANGGTNYASDLVSRVTEANSANPVSVFEPQPRARVDLPPRWYGPMLEGFKGVTSAEEGTAAEAFRGYPHALFPVAGKTGTAQVDDMAEDTSLFASFAPADRPRFASSVVLPGSGFGSDAAAPLTRVIMEAIARAGGQLSGLPKAPLGGDLDAKPVVRDPFDIQTQGDP